MKKFIIIISGAISILLIMSSCTSISIVKAGKPLSGESGYVSILFTNKQDIISFNKKYVYFELRQSSTGKRLYIPFGYDNESRLILIPPGDYHVHDILVMAGSGSVEGRDAQKEEPGLILGALPTRPRATYISTNYPEDYLVKFTVHPGQIVYMGDYSYESKFELTGSGVTINRTFDHADTIFSDIIAEHPNMPDSIRVISLEDAEKGAPDFDIGPTADEKEDLIQPVLPDEEGTPIIPPQPDPTPESGAE